MSDNLSSIPLSRIDGTQTTLADYAGKVLLIVNVASKCGLTPQYQSLQKLYDEKHDQGLEILGFPANNFGGQEPGTEEEIKEFCSFNYNVTFPMFKKISVVGDDRHPLYNALIKAQPEAEATRAMRDRLATHNFKAASDEDVLWNFEKFLIDRHGQVIGRFSPDMTVDDARIRVPLEKALAS